LLNAVRRADEPADPHRREPLDRRHVLTALTAAMLGSLVLIAMAPNFAFLMAARALLGVTIGGFWSLSTATIMRPFLETHVHASLGQLSLLLLGLGAAGFAGTSAATALLKHHVYRLLRGLPLALAAVTLAMLVSGPVPSSAARPCCCWRPSPSAVATACGRRPSIHEQVP
jgi:predicted MFS family arabinose efflux permease